MTVEIWRFCAGCGYVGETKLRRCPICAERTKSPGPALRVLPIPVDALKAAYAAGGTDAVFAMLGEVFKVTPETLQALYDGFGDQAFAGLSMWLPITNKRLSLGFDPRINCRCMVWCWDDKS